MAPTALPPAPLCAVLTGAAHWHTVDCISDLHLQASEPATFLAWQRYMQTTSASALFILGDLFEVWVGDDVLRSASLSESFESQCAQMLRTTAQRIPVYLLVGNRDFLLGADFLSQTHVQGMHDPTVLDLRTLNGAQFLLTHGDALCLDDTEYQRFRAQVRSPTWQEAFLAKPLVERQLMGRQLRAQSQIAQTQRADAGLGYSDVDVLAVIQWLDASGAQHMVHGHTHRPADHVVHGAAVSAVGGNAPHHPSQPQAMRYVLSDWDANAMPARTEVLRINAQGVRRIAL